MVLGWGDPLVLFKPTNMEKPASDQNNLLFIFDVLRKHASDARPILNYPSISCHLCAMVLHMEDLVLLYGCVRSKG
jgi:hypothetical protein